MEKRRTRRYKKQLTVLFGERMREHIGFTVDVSEEGLLLRANRVYPPGTGVLLELSALDQQKMYCRGVVKWVKRVPPNLVHLVKNGMGIFLTEAPMEYWRFIQQLNSSSFPPIRA